ncbi:serine/threonine-protein kinase [Spirillospora sp. CA-253888]
MLRTGDPARLGAYRLTGRLGEGGQGTVYLAEAPGGGRVAVKLLRGGLGGDAEARARFLRELETAKRVARFCTAAVLDAEVEGDRPFIVSEYVAGPSLQQVVQTEGPREDGALERLAIGTATALVAIHRAGVVHRDLKPHNVLLGPDGPRVIDFGVARALDGATITAQGAVGTPAYMAPEQFAGERAGPAADVFAWAGTLVFASCGRPPFGNDSMAAVVNRTLHGAPDLGALTGPLRGIAARCLDKDPARRPSSAELLRILLGEDEPQATEALTESALHAGAAAVAPPGTASPHATTARLQPPPPARHKAGRAGVVAVAAAVVAVAAAAVVSVVALSANGDDGRREAGGAPTSPTRSTAAPAGFPSDYAGRWAGRLRQSDGKQVLVRLALPAGGLQGQVSYPGQNCSGSVTLAASGRGTLTLNERITLGAARCVGSGTITLTRGAAGLDFAYSGTEQRRTWAVVGTLRKAG